MYYLLYLSYKKYKDMINDKERIKCIIIMIITILKMKMLKMFYIISKHFDKTRYHSWLKIEEFSKCFETNSLIADVVVEMDVIVC